VRRYLRISAHPSPIYYLNKYIGVIVKNPIPSDYLPPLLPGERFFFGRVPHSIIKRVASLAGTSLATYLAIWDRTKLDGTGKPVTLPNAFALDPWGVNRHAKARALRSLEAVGLIHVQRSPGRAPRIMLLDPRVKGKAV